MWLIRKIVMRRNIADVTYCIRKLTLDAAFIVRASETRRFCILHHGNNTGQVSRAACLIDSAADCCLHYRQQTMNDLRARPEPARRRGRSSSAIGRIFTMKRTAVTLFVAITALAAAACGQTIEQRAATGAVAGAVVAGPIGAAVGGAAGAAVGQAEKPN
jgi:hypothetical protein